MIHLANATRKSRRDSTREINSFRFQRNCKSARGNAGSTQRDSDVSPRVTARVRLKRMLSSIAVHAVERMSAWRKRCERFDVKSAYVTCRGEEGEARGIEGCPGMINTLTSRVRRVRAHTYTHIHLHRHTLGAHSQSTRVPSAAREKRPHSYRRHRCSFFSFLLLLRLLPVLPPPSFLPT